MSHLGSTPSISTRLKMKDYKLLKMILKSVEDSLDIEKSNVKKISKELKDKVKKFCKLK